MWTTDKDGIIAALLAAEMTAKTGDDPGMLYGRLTDRLGRPTAGRIEAPADREQMRRLSSLSAAQVDVALLAGAPVERVDTVAPGNGEPIGGIKVSAAAGWFAARPSGTEPLYKIYAESFEGPDHLQRLFSEAQAIVDEALVSR